MSNYATTDDIIAYGRPLTADELAVAGQLLTAVSAQLRLEADRRGYDLDAMVAASADLAEVAKSVTVQVVTRYLNQGTTEAAMTQVSQTAGPYNVQGTYLVPGGGIFIKRSELAALGLRRQRWGAMEVFDVYEEHH